MKTLFSSLLLLTLSLVASAIPVPSLRLPLDCEPHLSANFAELRPDHFHSGLDFKTEGRTGLPVHAVADGYVSAVEVSPWGYGRAVYVTHPSLGLVTVYGHLEAFSPAVDRYVRVEQYRRETFAIDMEFLPSMFPVKKGDVIGLSGNAGSSMGPHLHFNVHDAVTGDALDPMAYYMDWLKDTSKPYYRTIYLFPDEGHGIADGHESGPATRSHGEAHEPFTAWGRVYPAIRCNDEMTGETNIYGVKYLALYVDGRLVWGRDLNRFRYAATRAINTLVDYNLLMNGGGWTEWTRVPASRPLSDIIGAGLDNGAIVVDSERDYNCRYVLCDAMGHMTEVPFVIRGRRHTEPYRRPRGTLMRWDGNNRYGVDGAVATFAPGTAYDDFRFDMSRDTVTKSDRVTHIYNVGVREVAMSRPFTLRLSLDGLASGCPRQLCLVRMSGDRLIYAGGTVEDGLMTASLWRMGRYGVIVDNNAPKIEILPADGDKLSVRITDDLSGVASYKATIDGRFALFEYDAKNDILTFRRDPSRFAPGTYLLSVTVTDNCGNRSVASSTFTW